MVTKDEQAIKNIRWVLSGIERLFRVNETGLMARLVVPVDSPLARTIERQRREFRQRKLEDGKVWISVQDRGVTRDQYLGVLFGLSTVYEHVAEDYEDIGSVVKRLLALQFDFMMRNNWFLLGGETKVSIPNFWAPGSDQKYAYLAVNNFVTGGKYQAQLNEIRRGVPAVWLEAWLNTCDTVTHYYKFNLAYLSYYCILHFETDPLIRKHIHEAHRALESAIHNHLNPHFDLIRIDFGSVEKEQLADNQWERNPWRLARYPGNKRIESIGLSITWPYWFGRYLGVFSADD